MDREELKDGLGETSRYILSHHKPENYCRCYSLSFLNRNIRLCARCIGIYIGLTVGLVQIAYLGELPLLYVALSGIPTLIEKYFTEKRDRRGYNSLRTASGLLLGTGYINGLKILVNDLINPQILLVGLFYLLAASYLLLQQRHKGRKSNNIMSLERSDSKLSKKEKAPGFELENYKGENVALSDLDNYDGVLIIFMCNHCPYVKAQTEEIRKLTEEFSSIAVVGINPNSEVKREDSVEKMRDFVEENNLESPHFYYLSDPEQEVARGYGAKCTPDPFLLDWRHRLHYHGRLNDKMNPDQKVNNREMKEVIEEMLKRREPPEKQKPSQGCSIKWKE